MSTHLQWEKNTVQIVSFALTYTMPLAKMSRTYLMNKCMVQLNSRQRFGIMHRFNFFSKFHALKIHQALCTYVHDQMLQACAYLLVSSVFIYVIHVNLNKSSQ